MPRRRQVSKRSQPLHPERLLGAYMESSLTDLILDSSPLRFQVTATDRQLSHLVCIQDVLVKSIASAVAFILYPHI